MIIAGTRNPATAKLYHRRRFRRHAGGGCIGAAPIAGRTVFAATPSL